MARIKINRGDTRSIDVTFLQSDGITPIDITGGSVFFTVNASNSPTDDSAAVVSKTVTSHTSPTLGMSRISLAAADTTNVTPGNYFYDVQLKDASGNIISSKQDKFVISADITRRTS